MQVTSSISELTSKLNSFKISNTSGSGDNSSSLTSNKPASTHGHAPSHRFGEATKTVSNPNFLYNGNPKQWQLHKKKLLNIIWAINLSRLEAIKILKLSLNGQALFVSDNIDMTPFENSCNGNGDGHLEYLQGLEALFVGTAAFDLSRSSFATATQERNEAIPLCASRLISLFSSAFPDETAPNNNILVIDKFLSGLKDDMQKMFILQNME